MRRTHGPRAAVALVGAVAVAAALVAVLPGGAGHQAAGTPPPAAGSTGCGRPPRPGPTAHALAGDVPQQLRVGSTVRTYRLAVPADYRPRRPVPLVLDFHGSGSDALQQAIYSGMARRAAAAGDLVATPNAVKGKWQVSTPGSATPDLAFVSALLDDLEARYCVDESRVYAAGFSLGSEFAAIAACSEPRRIAAVGLVAAEFLLRPCPRRLAVLDFHGTADPLVAYRPGGVGRSLPGIPVPGVVPEMDQWARLDGCRTAPQRTQLAPDVVRRSWPDCRGGTAVVLYTVLGGGHTWPGSPITLPPVFGPTTHSIDATGLMLSFFRRFALPGPAGAQ